MPKIAKLSFLSEGSNSYSCKHPWPEDCFCQGGTNGIVYQTGTMEEAFSSSAKSVEVVKDALTGTSAKSHYITAFFEAFPRDPDTFLRGEGKSLEEAEESCWKKYLKVTSCKSHSFNRRGRTDGYCYCACGLSGTFLDPLHYCIVCDSPTSYCANKRGEYFCKDHVGSIRQEDKTELHIMMDELGKSVKIKI